MEKPSKKDHRSDAYFVIRIKKGGGYDMKTNPEIDFTVKLKKNDSNHQRVEFISK